MHSFRPTMVNQVRAGVLWMLRALAFLMLLVGGTLLIKRVIFGITQNDFASAWNAHMGVGEWHEFSNGAALMGAGVLLAFLASPLARWIVSLPPEDCPRCLHSGITTGMDRCPECGLG